MRLKINRFGVDLVFLAVSMFGVRAVSINWFIFIIIMVIKLGLGAVFSVFFLILISIWKCLCFKVGLFRGDF